MSKKKKRETREEALARIKREGEGAKPYTGNRGGWKQRPGPEPKPEPWYKRYNPFNRLAEGPLKPTKPKKEKGK